MDAPILQLAAGDTFHERYEVVRMIGMGGMGAVYEVLDRKTRRRRALKVLKPDCVRNDDVRRRFEREAVILAEVDSEHLAETLDAGVDDATSTPFMVMELLKGVEVGDLLRERGRLPGDEVVALLMQAAQALDKAHSAGVVHRDLKPANLFVTYRDDGSMRIKVLDFGIAKITRASFTGPETHGFLGTPIYMAPEQVDGDGEVSSLTDVYALAQVAYTMLVGEPYWAVEERTVVSVYGLLMRIVKGASEPASARAAKARVELPGMFDPWFARATHVEPEKRHPSARDMIVDLAEALGVPLDARFSAASFDRAPQPRAVIAVTPQLDTASTRASVSAVASTLAQNRPASSRPFVLGGLVLASLAAVAISMRLDRSATETGDVVEVPAAEPTPSAEPSAESSAPVAPSATEMATSSADTTPVASASAVASALRPRPPPTRMPSAAPTPAPSKGGPELPPTR